MSGKGSRGGDVIWHCEGARDLRQGISIQWKSTESLLMPTHKKRYLIQGVSYLNCNSEWHGKTCSLLYNILQAKASVEKIQLQIALGGAVKKTYSPRVIGLVGQSTQFLTSPVLLQGSHSLLG